jgi:methionine aminopeptidase
MAQDHTGRDHTVIQPGDIVNNDIGIVYMGFHTDYKGTGYVLRPGETEPPKGLQEAFQNSLRLSIYPQAKAASTAGGKILTTSPSSRNVTAGWVS